MNYFDELSADLKLHIFSFLSVYDAAALAVVSRKNRDMFRSIEYWRQRSRLDYARLPGENDARGFYRQCHDAMMAELLHEYDVVFAIKWMMDNLAPDIEDGQPTPVQQNMLHDRGHGLKVFEMRSREQYFKRYETIRDKYIDLGDVRDASDEEMLLLKTVCAPQASIAEIVAILSGNYFDAVSGLMAVLVNSRAKLSLKIFMQKLPHDIFQQEEMMYWGNYFFQIALYYRDVEIIDMLLDYGLGPNALGVNDDLNIIECPLKCVLRSAQVFMEKMDRLEVMAEFATEEMLWEMPEDFHQYYLDSIAAYSKCISLLLARGADPELLTSPDMTYQVTPRAMALEARDHLLGRNDLPADIIQNMVTALELIISAPACAVEPVMKRLRY